MIKIIILLSTILIPMDVFCSENQKEVQGKTVEESKKDKNWGIAYFALPFESPETRWGIGGTAIYYNNPHPEIQGSKLNETQVFGAFTQNSQKALGLITERYYRRDKYKLSGIVKLDKWPETIWGIGPETMDALEEEFTDTSFYLNVSFMKKIKNNLYIGPLLRVYNSSINKTEPDGYLQRKNISGKDGTTTTGSGIHINWDERDNTFYPHNGFWLEIISALYRKEFGSDYNYFKFEINHRNYIQVYKDHVIAYQGIGQFSSGKLPFQSLYEMGGQNMMRGIYSGRYRDKNHIAGQVEYRFPIAWRFGGVINGAIAEVAPSLDKFNLDNFVYTWGIGLRFTVDKKKHINFRLDVGFNEDFDSSVYFTVKEAF